MDEIREEDMVLLFAEDKVIGLGVNPLPVMGGFIRNIVVIRVNRVNNNLPGFPGEALVFLTYILRCLSVCLVPGKGQLSGFRRMGISCSMRAGIPDDRGFLSAHQNIPAKEFNHGVK